MKEPTRNRSLASLEPYVADKLKKVMKAMEEQGYDPMLFEGRRSIERQQWLYGYGRSHHKNQKPKTWTLNSRHIPGKAGDIISRSRGWDWPEFFVVLRHEANKVGLRTVPQEGCHIEWS